MHDANVAADCDEAAIERPEPSELEVAYNSLAAHADLHERLLREKCDAALFRADRWKRVAKRILTRERGGWQKAHVRAELWKGRHAEERIARDRAETALAEATRELAVVRTERDEYKGYNDLLVSKAALTTDEVRTENAVLRGIEIPNLRAVIVQTETALSEAKADTRTIYNDLNRIVPEQDARIERAEADLAALRERVGRLEAVVRAAREMDSVFICPDLHRALAALDQAALKEVAP